MERVKLVMPNTFLDATVWKQISDKKHWLPGSTGKLTTWLVVVCIIDAVVSGIGYNQGWLYEVNVLMRGVLEAGASQIIAVKLVQIAAVVALGYIASKRVLQIFLSIYLTIFLMFLASLIYGVTA